MGIYRLMILSYKLVGGSYANWFMCFLENRYFLIDKKPSRRYSVFK